MTTTTPWKFSRLPDSDSAGGSAFFELDSDGSVDRADMHIADLAADVAAASDAGPARRLLVEALVLADRKQDFPNVGMLRRAAAERQLSLSSLQEALNEGEREAQACNARHRELI